MVLQETYELWDCKYYADNTKISSWSQTSRNNGVSYISNYVLGVGETASFKLSTLPNMCIFGIGNTSKEMLAIQKDNNKTVVYVNGSNTQYQQQITTNTIISMKLISDSVCEIYLDDRLLHTVTNTNGATKTLYVHKYNSYTYTMDYVKVL